MPRCLQLGLRESTDAESLSSSYERQVVKGAMMESEVLAAACRLCISSNISVCFSELSASLLILRCRLAGDCGTENFGTYAVRISRSRELLSLSRGSSLLRTGRSPRKSFWPVPASSKLVLNALFQRERCRPKDPDRDTPPIRRHSQF